MMKVQNTKRQGSKTIRNSGLARRSIVILISVAVVIAIGVFGFIGDLLGL